MIDIQKIWSLSDLRQLSNPEWIELQEHLFAEFRAALGIDIIPKNFDFDIEGCSISGSFAGPVQDHIAELFSIEGIMGMQAEEGRVYISSTVFVFLYGKRARHEQGGDHLEFEYRKEREVIAWHCLGWVIDQYGEFRSIDRPGLLK
jgi:hypothetical protein